MVAAARAFEGGCDLVYGNLQRQEQMDLIARSQVSRGLTLAVAAGVALLLTRSALWVAAAMAGAYGVWMASDLGGARARLAGERFAPSRDWPRVTRLIRTAAPLGLVTAIGSLQVNLPRYFLDAYASRAEQGIFSSLAQLLILGSVVIGALANAVVPRMARQAAAGEWPAFKRQLTQLIGLGLVIGLAAVAVAATLGRPLLRLVYTDEYAQHADVLVWLAVTSGFLWSYAFLGTALNAMRRFRIQPWIHAISTAVIAVVAALEVPDHRLLGAAWAMLIGYAVECALYLVYIAWLFRTMARGTP